MKHTIALLTTLLLTPLAGVAAAETSKPNIVFLLADDLGDGDLHCYGHPYARTPNIDSLARDGTRFLQYHAAGCTYPDITMLPNGWFRQAAKNV